LELSCQLPAAYAPIRPVVEIEIIIVQIPTELKSFLKSIGCKPARIKIKNEK
jgi:hypothetical protein